MHSRVALSEARNTGISLGTFGWPVYAWLLMWETRVRVQVCYTSTQSNHNVHIHWTVNGGWSTVLYHSEWIPSVCGNTEIVVIISLGMKDLISNFATDLIILWLSNEKPHDFPSFILSKRSRWQRCSDRCWGRVQVISIQCPVIQRLQSWLLCFPVLWALF